MKKDNFWDLTLHNTSKFAVTGIGRCIHSSAAETPVWLQSYTVIWSHNLVTLRQ